MAECPFAIMTIPELKKPCLFYRREEDNALVKIAQFNDKYAQKIFLDELNRWVSAVVNEQIERVLQK